MARAFELSLTWIMRLADISVDQVIHALLAAALALTVCGLIQLELWYRAVSGRWLPRWKAATFRRLFANFRHATASGTPRKSLVGAATKRFRSDGRAGS